MKKNLLAASLALALGTMAGTASAALTVNDGGIGHLNIVPYYSVQDGNNTLLTITNTDTDNGKIVKVRFRAAEWSDDALDFQVFLSPMDVWTAAFGMVDGQLKLVTDDNSCTLPLNISGQTFATTRVEGGSIDRLKEGYVEIFDVADIPPKAQAGNQITSVGTWNDWANLWTGDLNTDNPLFTAVKHVNGVAPCTGSLLEGLVEDSTNNAGNVLNTTTRIKFAAAAAGAATDTAAELIKPENQRSWMAPPTGGLITNATVIAVGESKAFTVPTVAITTDGADDDYAVVQYFRQSNVSVATTPPAFGVGATAVTLGDLTADRLFWPVNDTVGIAGNRQHKQGVGYTLYQFDLPDVSTPFWLPDNVAANAAPGAQTAVNGTDHLAELWRDQIAALLRKSVVISDYEISSSAGASTDIVLSQPVRRYYYSYTGTTSGYNRTILGANWLVKGLTGTTYEPLEVGNTIVIGGATFYDREEQHLVSSSDIVPSPQEPGVAVAIRLKGETSVVSVKHGEGATGALGARLTAVDWSFSPSYTSGWVSILPVVTGGIDSTGTNGSGSTPTNTFLRGDARLPVVGFTAINVFNASAGANGTNYGLGMPLRYVK